TPLDIPGEAVWRVPSLAMPDASAMYSLQALSQFSAVRLLIQRASRPQAPFSITEDNADSVVRICRRLDGIPLAIELAAVQIHRRFRTAEEVAASLIGSLSAL